MQNIGYVMDWLLRTHTYKNTVIHRISYLPFEQQGPGVNHQVKGIHMLFRSVNADI